jgi:Fibronectin type III domain
MQTISEQTAGCVGKVLGVLSRIMRPAIVLGGILLLALLHNPAQAAASIILAWTPSLSPNTAGYDIYYGVTNGIYTQMVNVGNVTTATLSSLTGGTTYYFAVTAYNLFGVQSVLSNQASYALPATLTGLQIRAAPAGMFTLTVTGPIGQTNEILATQNFTVWTVIGTVRLEAGGTFDFTDTNAANYPMRFYRTREVP